MRVIPIKTNKQNNKKQSFTAIKADKETFLTLKSVAKQLNVDLYSIEDIGVDSYHGRVYKSVSLGHLIPAGEKACLSEIKDTYLTLNEVIDVQLKFFKNKLPIVQQLKELAAKAKTVTLQEANEYEAKVMPEIVDARKRTNTILGCDIFNLDNLSVWQNLK